MRLIYYDRSTHYENFAGVLFIIRTICIHCCMMSLKLITSPKIHNEFFYHNEPHNDAPSVSVCIANLSTPPPLHLTSPFSPVLVFSGSIPNLAAIPPTASCPATHTHIFVVPCHPPTHTTHDRTLARRSKATSTMEALEMRAHRPLWLASPPSSSESPAFWDPSDDESRVTATEFSAATFL